MACRAPSRPSWRRLPAGTTARTWCTRSSGLPLPTGWRTRAAGTRWRRHQTWAEGRVQLLSGHEAVALVGLALAATGTGSPMFVRHATPDGLDGRVRRVGLGAAVLGAAVAAAALATG